MNYTCNQEISNINTIYFTICTHKREPLKLKRSEHSFKKIVRIYFPFSLLLFDSATTLAEDVFHNCVTPPCCLKEKKLHTYYIHTTYSIPGPPLVNKY